MADPSDHELLRRLRSGEEAGFVELFRRWQGPLFRFALRMSGSETTAEDVVQDVFMTLIRDQHDYDPGRGPLGPFLYGIARNQVLRRLERERSSQPLPEPDEQDHEADSGSDDPLQSLTRQEAIAAVRQAVLALPAHYREAVVLCDLHALSYQEAARALDCAVGTVRSRLHRARALLISRLRDHAPDAARRAGGQR
jgi:RNA polymerase sigma-70 factor (ECF subfamily)